MVIVAGALLRIGAKNSHHHHHLPFLCTCRGWVTTTHEAKQNPQGYDQTAEDWRLTEHKTKVKKKKKLKTNVMAAEVTVTNRQASKCLAQPNSSVNHHRNFLKWYRVCKGGIRYAFKITLSRLSFAVSSDSEKSFGRIYCTVQEI